VLRLSDDSADTDFQYTLECCKYLFTQPDGCITGITHSGWTASTNVVRSLSSVVFVGFLPNLVNMFTNIIPHSRSMIEQGLTSH